MSTAARHAVIALALVVAVLSGAACGADEGDTDEPTSTTRTTAVTTTSVPAQTLECQQVVFTPDSEDGASDVRATGLPCDEAEAFVRVAGKQTSSGGPQQLDVEGYHCRVTDSASDPLPRSTYECVNGSKTVTFVRT